MSFWTNRNLHPKIKSRFVVSFGTGFSLPNVRSVTKPAVEVATKEYRLMNHYFNYPGLVRWQPIKITFVDMNGAYQRNTGFNLNKAAYKAFDTSSMLYQMLLNSGYFFPSEPEQATADYRGVAYSSGITSPEKASTIANSFGDGLYNKEKNTTPESPSSTKRTMRIQQINFGFDRASNHRQRIKDTRNPTEKQRLTEIGPSDDTTPNANVVEEWVLVNPIITNISWGDLDYGSDDLVEYTLDIKYDWAELTTDDEGDVGGKKAATATNKFNEF